MTMPRRLLVVAIVTAVGAAACGDTSAEFSPADVEIEIEIEGGQRWSASGTSVGLGLICQGGSQRWIGYRLHDGSVIDYDEAVVLKQMQPALVLIETQLGCADGTGAISIAWEPHEDDRWMVVGGTGAYSGATGGGAVHEDEGFGQPLALHGEISTG